MFACAECREPERPHARDREDLRDLGEAAAALSSDRGARYLGGGTLVMRALNEGDLALSTVVRATTAA